MLAAKVEREAVLLLVINLRTGPGVGRKGEAESGPASARQLVTPKAAASHATTMGKLSSIIVCPQWSRPAPEPASGDGEDGGTRVAKQSSCQGRGGVRSDRTGPGLRQGQGTPQLNESPVVGPPKDLGRPETEGSPRGSQQDRHTPSATKISEIFAAHHLTS